MHPEGEEGDGGRYGKGNAHAGEFKFIAHECVL